MTDIHLPNCWNPRKHQLPLLQYFENGGTRGVAVWHRRAGKDSTGLNLTAPASYVRKGLYWHMLPTATQGRKVIWDGIGIDGVRFIDQAFPKEIRRGVNNTEMKIELKNGSIWQVVGSDNYDSLVGSNPVGVIFSEYSIADPAAWNYIRPILRENGGWALFIYTARGPNHGYEMYKMALNNPEWFCEKLTIDDTGVMSGKDVQEELDAGMAHEMVQQEFYCSFDAPMVGSFFGDLIVRMQNLKPPRITPIPWDSDHPVQTWWDLGVNDMNTILFSQYIAQEWRFIDFIEDNNKGIAEYADMLKNKGYQFNFHGAPHDAAQRSIQTNQSLVETARNFGIEFTLIPRSKNLTASHQSVRAHLPKVWIDSKRCERVIDGLRNYRREWDDKEKVFRKTPVHDWSSHIVDAVRSWADGHELMSTDAELMLVNAHGQTQPYDPFNPPPYGIGPGGNAEITPVGYYPQDSDSNFDAMEYIH